MRIYYKGILFLTSIFLQYFVIRAIRARTVNHWSLLFWLLSIVLFYFSYPNFKSNLKKTTQKKSPPKVIFLLGGVITFALCLRIYYMSDLSRFHGDEYLTGYFSYTLPKLSQLDWFGVYPPKGAWVSQFPLFFFFFQKIFLTALGVNTLVLRFSVIPYILLVFLFLFLLARKLFNQGTAFFSVILLSVFTPSLYLSTLGLHFISSTALFLAAFYFFILSVKEGKKYQFGFLGLFTALCYFSYYSSYLAFPLFLGFLIVLIWQRKVSASSLKNFLLSLGIFILTLSPILTYALRIDNFFSQRYSQVSLFSGEWSPYFEKKLTLNDYLEILKIQLTKNTQSLYRDDIGGHGGYLFGRLALFDQLTFSLLLISIIYVFYKIMKVGYRKNFPYLALLAILASSFLGGMVLSIPPPAYHRSSLAFPFLTLLLGVFINFLYQISQKLWGKKISYLLVILFLLVFSISNLDHFGQMIARDKKQMPDNSEYLQIEEEVRKQKVKGVFISAYDSYALEKVLFFRFNGKRQFATNYFETLKKAIPPGQPALLIIHYPDEKTLDSVRRFFPQTTILAKYSNHLLLKLF